jgi:hypothetical protein
MGKQKGVKRVLEFTSLDAQCVPVDVSGQERAGYQRPQVNWSAMVKWQCSPGPYSDPMGRWDARWRGRGPYGRVCL